MRRSVWREGQGESDVRVFISYRREDTGWQAGRICDRLRRAYGDTFVFLDMDSVPVGDNFEAYVLGELEYRSQVVVVLIGPNWLGASAVGRRIDNELDLVRRELATTLVREAEGPRVWNTCVYWEPYSNVKDSIYAVGADNLPRYAIAPDNSPLLFPPVTIVPLLLDGASMPPAAQLPTDIREIVNRQAIRIAYHSFEDDMRNLSTVLAGANRKHLTPWLSMKVEDFCFDVDINRSLKAAGARLLGDVISRDESTWLQTLGREELARVKEDLAFFAGLRLGTDVGWWNRPEY
jgi:hypothetical protein